MDNLAAAGFGPFKISIVVTRHNVDQLDGFKALADSYGATLRVTRLRPSGRGADSWHELHPTDEQQRQIYRWLLDHGDTVLTGDSFFHLNALGEPLPGLNMCGAGRVVCLIDPVGDVYACPFVIHDEFRAGSVRDAGGFAAVWQRSELFRELREPESAGAARQLRQYDACQGGCMAAKFFTGLPLDGPDPSASTATANRRSPASARARPMMDRCRPSSRSTFLRSSAAMWAALFPAAYLLGTFPSAPSSPAQRRRHPAVRIGQPGRVERHSHARVAQGGARLRPRRR